MKNLNIYYLQGNQDYKLTENKVNRDINFIKKLNGCNVIPCDSLLKLGDPTKYYI